MVALSLFSNMNIGTTRLSVSNEQRRINPSNHFSPWSTSFQRPLSNLDMTLARERGGAVTLHPRRTSANSAFGHVYESSLSD